MGGSGSSPSLLRKRTTLCAPVEAEDAVAHSLGDAAEQLAVVDEARAQLERKREHEGRLTGAARSETLLTIGVSYTPSLTSRGFHFFSILYSSRVSWHVPLVCPASPGAYA